MLKVILNRHNPKPQEIIAEEQVGSDPEEALQNSLSTSVRCEKYSKTTTKVFYTLIYFKKAFDRYDMQPYGSPC